jgi:regulator of protease activity HflC (stomatin/prohibitin superfamily)
VFDKLIEWLKDIIGLFQFWVVLRPYERAIRYRLGRWIAELGPGPHLIFPFNIDEVVVENIVPEGVNLGLQSVTLKDGTPLSVDVEVMFRITNVDHFLNNIEDASAIMHTMLQGIIQRTLFQHTWEELLTQRAQAAEDGRKYSLEKRLQSEINRVLSDEEWGVEGRSQTGS